jgi:hypothetical protein
VKIAGAVALILGLSFGAGVEARELWSEGGASFEISGSVREIVRGTEGTSAEAFEAALQSNPLQCLVPMNFPDCPAFAEVGETQVWTALTRWRTRADLRLNSHWSAAIAYDLELLAGHLDTFESALGDGFRPDSLFRAEGVIAGNDRVELRHELYRGYLLYEAEHVEATLGRQRIPWGVGRLWNPIDRFNAVGPLAVEGDQSAGVDALDARWLFSGFTYLELVVAPLREPRDGSYALRLHGVWRDVDYSVMGGIFEEAPTVGVDLASNLGDAAVRLEAVFASPVREVWKLGTPSPEAPSDYWQLVLSIDYLFDVGNGVYTLVEHLYNGNALGFGSGLAGGLLPFFGQTTDCPPPLPTCVTLASDALFGGSRVVTRAEHLTGAQTGYDLTPEMRGELLVLFDWTGTSASFIPSVRYTPLDWLELSLGAQLFVGPAQSEFGNADSLVFLIAEAFF